MSVRASILISFWLLTAVPCAWLPVRSAAAADTAAPYVYRHENVLGTTFELQVAARDEPTARQAEKRALDEIDRLARIFSVYDPHSEFSQWLAQPREPKRVSPELLAVLQASDQWQSATQNAYHPGAAQLTGIWKQAAAKNRIPNEGDLWGSVIALKSPPWMLDAEKSRAWRTSSYPLNLDAIATGYILDELAQRLLELPGVTGVVANVGGDIRVAGNLPCRVDVADPFAQGDQAAPFVSLRLREGGATTSGAGQRGFTINGRYFSHILDPRSGKSANRIVSATVVAPTAIAADVLATALCVLPPEDGLALVKTLPGVECLLIDRDRSIFSSAGWNRLVEGGSAADSVPAPSGRSSVKGPAGMPESATAWNGGFELQLDIAINQVDGGGRYRRPYVSAWLEDADGFPVRTLVLWVQTSGPGPRWIPDLRRWYRADRNRKLVDDTDLVVTASSPTRNPGQYSMVWDGRDDHGKLLKPGEYTFLLESAREHGTYQLMRQKVTFADQPFQLKLPGNIEIKAASLEYRQRRPTPARHDTAAP